MLATRSSPAPADRRDDTPTPLVRRIDLADAMALPAFVEQVAEALWCYAGDTLDIVDLSPAGGVFAARLLRAMDRLAVRDGRAPDIRLYLCGGDASSLLRHRRVRDGVRHGQVCLHGWDPSGTDRPPVLRDRVAFLGMGYFQGLDVDLCATHYAQWFDGCMTVSPPQADGVTTVEGAWSPGVGDGPLEARYRDKLASAVLNLPSAGIRAVGAMASLTGGRYLLLAADHGVADLRDIADGGLALPSAWIDGSSAMPVNFHALACAQPDARVAYERTTAASPLLQVTMAGDEPADAFTRVLAPLRGGMDTALALREQARWLSDEAPAAVTLAVLRAAAFDPHALVLRGLREEGDALARSHWRDALQCSGELARDETTTDACQRVGACAADLGLWGLAVDVLAPLQASLVDDVADRLTWSLLHAGDVTAAQAMLGNPEDDEPAWKTYIRDHVRYCRALPWFAAAHAVDGELRLEPLAWHHAPSWLRQYRDPHIGIVTRLPALEDVDAVREWIAFQQADPQRACFALVDRADGFVGSVGYQHAGSAGYFHFWIGADHQNRGLGRRAARLLARQAVEVGIDVFYTSAYRDNTRSIAALHALGFQPMAAHAAPPDDDLLFFQQALGKGASPSIDGLRQLCFAIGCPFDPLDLSPDRAFAR
ncbi:GNAT family N-acetyltransferase [Luteibacter sp. 9135]|uniref:GNAT family N-acetyltransferase n=1 Tax=Luteibacter sp. 9135 TaxID=1500893 RepID=UPI000559D367|nr:GNAT family N-acetyltransferase [Luteibacter sp. 9135]